MPSSTLPAFPVRGVLIGAAFFALRAAAETVILVVANSTNAHFSGIALSNAREACLFGVLALACWYWTMMFIRQALWKQVLAQLLAAVVYGVGGFWLNAAGFKLQIGFVPPAVLANAPWVQLSHVIEYAALCAVWYVIESRKRLREQRERERELVLLNTQMELSMLKAQMNPHFLFNALNTVNALVGSSPELARSVITSLADILRYALESDRRQYVALGEELEFVKKYLAIEQARFGSRLQTGFDVPPDLAACLVPPMLLQPLVENAVRHGIAPKPEGGRVTLTAWRERGAEGSDKRDLLALCVSDDGVGMASLPAFTTHLVPAEASQFQFQSHAHASTGGRGLAHTDARLRKMFGAEAGLRLESSLEASADALSRHTTVSFRIPIGFQ
jgi:two-component system, LytTR family, sensor kinase